MGQRSAAESVASILLAFVKHSTWRQAELAERVGISVPALRRRLRELQDAGMVIEREVETPQVFWSVPRGWFPGGVVLAGRELEDVLRLVMRAPKSEARRRVLRALVSAGAKGSTEHVVVAGSLPADEERYLATLEDCAAQRVVARIRYASRSHGVAKWRHVSVHRIVPGATVRLIVFCHATGALRWFRLDHVRGAEVDEAESYHAVSDEVLGAFHQESVGGFHGGGEACVVSFLVRDPEARWVAENLPSGWEGAVVAEGIRVTVRTASLEQVARYVVGLGAAARAETPSLAEEVRSIALGALRGAGARGIVRSVGSKESGGWGAGVG